MEVAREIGRVLLSERLAACVNIVPQIQSMYRWKGAVEESSETLLMIKTRSSLVAPLTARVRQLHPYEVCEVIACAVTGGNQAYLDWVHAETKDE